MLNDEQINKILEGRISELGAIGGAVGGLTGSLGGVLGGGAGGAIGGKLGSKLLPIDHKSESMPHSSQNEIVRSVKDYFGSSLIHESHENDTYYLVGTSGSGFFNMNPCVLELVVRSDKLEIFAHAKEGLIKQKTCIKSISKLKKYLALS